MFFFFFPSAEIPYTMVKSLQRSWWVGSLGLTSKSMGAEKGGLNFMSGSQEKGVWNLPREIYRGTQLSWSDQIASMTRSSIGKVSTELSVTASAIYRLKSFD